MATSHKEVYTYFVGTGRGSYNINHSVATAPVILSEGALASRSRNCHPERSDVITSLRSG